MIVKQEMLTINELLERKVHYKNLFCFNPAVSDFSFSMWRRVCFILEVGSSARKNCGVELFKVLG
ncbi:MAG: hypothetical protein QM751_00420 [Paludibacteraceae bacterium]